METEAEITAWVREICTQVRRETLVWVAGRSLPFGVAVTPHQKRYVDDPGIYEMIKQELSSPGDVFTMGTCPGLLVELIKRLGDWFILVVGYAQPVDAPVAEVPVFNPIEVRDILCLTTVESLELAREVKLDEHENKHSMPDDDLRDMVLFFFNKYHDGLMLHDSAIALQIARTRKLCRENTLLQLHGLQPGCVY